MGYEHAYDLKLFKARARGGLLRFRTAADLKSAVRTLPDNAIAHLHGVFNPELFVLSRLLKRKGVPWVFSPHGGYPAASLRNRRFLKRLYLMFFEGKLLNGARAIHAVSSQEGDDIRAITDHKRIVVVRNGQDLAGLGVPRASPKPRPYPIFGFCGRLTTQAKGLDLVIDGFAAYRKNGGRGELWLVGDGADADSLRARVINNKNEGAVRFLGPMFGQAKLNCLVDMDVFVHTSRWEGMPTAVIEAAGLSRPLLVSQQTNVGEFVKQYRSGLVLEENEPVAIAGAMHLLEARHEDGTLRAMGERALVMAKKEFDWEQLSTEIIEKVYSAG